MKVIRTSNFDHEDERGDQYVVGRAALTIEQATELADLLNKFEGEQSDDYYRVVPDDHVCWKFDP